MTEIQDKLNELVLIEDELNKRKIKDPLGFIQLYPKQQEFVDSKATILLFFAGNRAGKSFSGAYKAIQLALYEGLSGWVISKSGSTQKNAAQKLVLEIIPKERIKKYRAFKGVAESIELDNGAMIDFKTFDQGRERLQGASIYWAWFDEEPPKDVYEEVKMRTIDQEGVVFFTMTPLLGMTWIYHTLYLQSLEDKNNDRIKIIQASLYDNIFIAKGAIKEVEKDCVGDERMKQMRIYGKFTELQDVIYPQFAPEQHVIRNLPIIKKNDAGREIKIRYENLHGLDPGATHPTAGIFIKVDFNNNEPIFYIIDEYIKNDTGTDEHAYNIKDIMGGEIYKWNFIDQAAAQYRIDFHRLGIDYMSCVKRTGHSKNSTDSGISLIRSLFNENRLFILSHCRNTIFEFQRYRYDDRKNIIKSGDDLMDAVRYAIYSYIHHNVKKNMSMNITNNPFGYTATLY